MTGILGQGGFGTVYKGRLEGGEGFVKEVAIKLLSDENPDEEVLSRFRDEARILGLLRDRNIVSVDPPTRLGGRWAVVMEFVDGAACDRLLKKGAFPPGVALEIIEEVARTLDNLWSHPGSTGEPMHLLHRDIKPANIQITPNGQVKVLDFGIAKATFGNRETETTDHIGGTVGYIAPERLEGEEGPRGDVYSLGVVLHELVTNKRPRPGRRFEVPADPAAAAVAELAANMRELEPEDRPSAREVEKRCRELRGKLGGLDLRDWARTEVPHTSTIAPDDLVGQRLTETLSGIPRMPTELPTALRPRKGGVVLGVGAVLFMGIAAAVILTLLVVIGGLVMYRSGSGGEADVALTVPSTPGLEDVRHVDPQPEAGPEEPAEEAAAAPEPEPVAARHDPLPQPAAVAAAPAPTIEDVPEEPAGEVPAGGEVSVSGDADSVWFTSGGARFEAGALPTGSYEIRAVFGGKEVHAGTLGVQGGGSHAVKCMAAFKRCQIK